MGTFCDVEQYFKAFWFVFSVIFFCRIETLSGLYITDRLWGKVRGNVWQDLVATDVLL